MTVKGQSVESTFNEALGIALSQTTARWGEGSEIIQVEKTQTLAGKTNRAKRPDILVLEKQSPPVVIECSYDASDADKDAISRLGKSTNQGNLQIKTALSIHIPAKFRNQSFQSIVRELSNGQTINYALHQLEDRRWPNSGFLTGTIYDIALLIPAAALPKEEIELVAQQVADLVNQAADILEIALLPEQQEEIARLVHQRTPLKGLRTTMVLWLNALLTQQRLSMQGVQYAPHLEFAAELLPQPSVQVEIWCTILNENWRSIFEPAILVLQESGGIDPAATGQALNHLISAVEIIELTRVGLHINVGAELYPKLSDDRKQAAAFYTQPATAELLASLVVEHDAFDSATWKSGQIFDTNFLADLTCGTGTLLRAGYRRIQAFHEHAGGKLESAKRLHLNAMESGLIGTDISPIAAHLTASSLAAIGMGEPYGETCIGWLNIGGKNALTGALEYFISDAVVDLFEEVAGRSSGTEVEGNQILIKDNSVKWILMNPPYSRTRGGQTTFDVAGLNEQERKSCQKRWKKLVKHAPVNNRAGMGASFLALAYEKVKFGGRIGFVLPLTAAFADSWAITRKMVEREFSNVVAIVVASGQALGKDALSADTGMEEMLLVATKRKNQNSLHQSSPINCVTLYQPLNRVGEANEIARAISNALDGIGTSGSTRPIRAGEDELGQIAVFDAGGEGAPWSPLGVVHADLALAAVALENGIIDHFCSEPLSLNIEMVSIADLFNVGPTHHLIGHIQGNSPIGAFELHPVTNPQDAIGRDRSLWHADSTSQRQLIVLPTHKCVAPENVGSDAERNEMQQHRSTIHYARNMRWTSQTLLTASTEHPVMGGRSWAALIHDDMRVCKAFALWSNSTFGMVLHWTRGQRTHAGRSTTQIGALKQIPCPKLDALEDDLLDQAVDEFDSISKKILLPACQAHIDDVRSTIDESVIRMFRLPDETKDEVSKLRKLWCSEPSVHGSNKTALKMLKATNK